jgi:hypothetical protein
MKSKFTIKESQTLKETPVAIRLLSPKKQMKWSKSTPL